MFFVFIMEILALVIMGLGAAGLLFEVLSETAGKTPSSTNARHVVENDVAAAPKNFSPIIDSASDRRLRNRKSKKREYGASARFLGM